MLAFLLTPLLQLFRRYDFEVINPITPLVALPHSVFIVKDMYVRITEREKQGKDTAGAD